MMALRRRATTLVNSSRSFFPLAAAREPALEVVGQGRQDRSPGTLVRWREEAQSRPPPREQA